MTQQQEKAHCQQMDQKCPRIHHTGKEGRQFCTCTMDLPDKSIGTDQQCPAPGNIKKGCNEKRKQPIFPKRTVPQKKTQSTENKSNSAEEISEYLSHGISRKLYSLLKKNLSASSR